MLAEATTGVDLLHFGAMHERSNDGKLETM